MEYNTSCVNNNCENNVIKSELDLNKSKDQCNYFKSSYARSLSFSKNRVNLSVNDERVNVNCEPSDCDLDQLENTNNFTFVNVNDDDLIKTKQKKNQPSIEEIHHFNQRCGATDTSYFDSILLQTQVNTLQWQLKQVESTRQMYQTVLEEVVRFLKKCYQHLNLLVEPWPRSKSEKHIVVTSDSCSESISNFEPMRAQSTINLHNIAMPCLLEKQFHKFSRAGDTNNNSKFNLNLDTEKLSNEAFRLYRTTENLINMRGPTLLPIPQNNDNFTVESKTNEKISQSHKIYDTFLNASDTISSLDFNEHKNKNIDRISLRSGTTGSIHSSSSKSSEMTDEGVQNISKISSTIARAPSIAMAKQLNPVHNKNRHQFSPINCILDVESGFSSMNSFQEIGLPLVNNSTHNVMTQNSLTHSNDDEHDQITVNRRNEIDTDCTLLQRKWSSLPMSLKKNSPAPLFEFKCDETLKVLWV